MRRSHYIVALLLLSLGSCQEIIDVEGLPYEERLVINGLLHVHSPSNLIQISRTMPLNVQYDTSAAFLADAEGSIICDGVTYPLVYTGTAGLYDPEGLRPEFGKTYMLNVRWRHMSAFATTSIPQPGTIDSAWITEEMLNFGHKRYVLNMRGQFDPDVSVTTRNTVYGHYLYNQRPPTWFSAEPELQRSEKDGSPTILKSYLDFWFDEGLIVDSVNAVAQSFAPGYYEFYQSRRNEGDQIPGGSPVPVKWNVTGQAIGIFFGVSVTGAKFKL